MKRHQLSRLAAALGFIIIGNSAFAAAFQLYELGTPIIGTAGVGQAVVANDASTSYFNPAGMAQFSNSQYLLGSQLVLSYINFSQRSQTTIHGNNGGDAGALIPGLDLYYIYSYSPKLKFGVNITSPYAGLLNYNDGWAGRYIVQGMQLLTLDLNPSVAYRINDWVSIGAGVTIEYANLHETIALPLTALIDGQANLKMANTSAGANAGVYIEPTNTTKIGVAYRSRITHSFTGNTTFFHISAAPATSTHMIMPQNVIVSLSQRLSNQFSLLGELGWANWSTMKNTVLTVYGYSATIPRNWIDTYRLGLGGQFQWTPAFLLQGGISYDSSPTSASLRMPDMPMDRQVRLGAGIMYSVMKAVKLGFSYEYINFGNAAINNFSSDGALVGSYSRNYANVLQASINVEC